MNQEPEPFAPTVVDGDELAALLDEIRSLTPCPDCDGQPSLLAYDGTIEATVPHRVDCEDRIARQMTAELRLILGEGGERS